jgi:hypothetical protein
MSKSIYISDILYAKLTVLKGRSMSLTQQTVTYEDVISKAIKMYFTHEEWDAFDETKQEAK